MRKHFMKKRMIGLYAMICAGMLLFTGCAGADPDVKTGAEKIEVSGEQNSNSADTPSTADEKVSEETETAALNDSQDEANVSNEKNGSGTMDTFEDANDMMKSADLSGTASGCSDTGCMIGSAFASVDEDGTSSSEAGGKIVFSDETIFQKGIVESDGSSYSLEDSEKSGLKDNDFVLCFGNQQEDGTYLAERIIVVTFN